MTKVPVGPFVGERYDFRRPLPHHPSGEYFAEGVCESLDRERGVYRFRVGDGLAVDFSVDTVERWVRLPMVDPLLEAVMPIALALHEQQKDENRHRLLRVMTWEYDSTGCPACAFSSIALKPQTPDLVLEHVCRDGRRVRFNPRTGARIVLP